MTNKIEFKLPDPSLEQYYWVFDGEHDPVSQTPLIAYAGDDIDSARATDEPPRALNIQGYTYGRAGAGGPGRYSETLPPESVEELQRWRTEWVPQVQALSARLVGFDPTAVATGTWRETLAELDAENSRVSFGIHSTAIAAAHLAVERFTNAYVARFGEDRRADTFALLQGLPNKSTDRAIALWDLSRLVRADAELSAALDKRADIPGSTPSREAFRNGLAILLQEYGHTSNTRQQDVPTWAEEPTVPFALVRAYARQDDDKSPRISADRQRDRRLELENEIRGHAPTDPDAAELARFMEIAQQILPNLEDHNLLADQRLVASSRARWLAIGAFLVERGVFASRDDIFYHTRAELLPVLEGGDALSTEEIAKRRALQRAYRDVIPPRTLGTARARPQAPTSAASEAAEAQILRGTAASAGSYQGTARVIKSLDDAGKLEQGDILVCVATTPSWSPYLALVGALVTNTGGSLSHSAVVAREFGVPAVVGTRSGTDRITDGSTITVDGTTGTVIVGGE